MLGDQVQAVGDEQLEETMQVAVPFRQRPTAGVTQVETRTGADKWQFEMQKVRLIHSANASAKRIKERSGVEDRWPPDVVEKI